MSGLSCLSALKNAVGSGRILTPDSDDIAALVTDWRKRYHGRVLAVAEPRTTAEVAALMRCAAQFQLNVIPQGGNTGLVGGGVPDDRLNNVLISTRKMNRVLCVDAHNATVTTQTGITLAELHAAVAQHRLLFPLSLPSEGSCTIGGNLATNAGGTAVLRYGNMRELTLGLEVVLPNGDVLSELAGLRKNNSGYDLKQWFIGSEGTLGVITAATLRLFPQPTTTATAWLEVPNPSAAITVLRALQQRFDAQLTAFELISHRCLQLVAQYFPEWSVPVRCPWSVLIELSAPEPCALHDLLAEALWPYAQHAQAVVAQNEAERQHFWRIRESFSEAQTRHGLSIKHDIAVPVSAIPEFIERGAHALRARFPSCQITLFGHVGDGNLHYNVSETRANPAETLADETEVNRIVFDLARQLGGTLSAEHGIGRLRRERLREYRDPVALELMHRIKTSFDPDGRMNPGVLL